MNHDRLSLIEWKVRCINMQWCESGIKGEHMFYRHYTLAHKIRMLFHCIFLNPSTTLCNAFGWKFRRIEKIFLKSYR